VSIEKDILGNNGVQRVVVFGASGFIGKAIFSRLTNANIPVLSLSSKEVDLSSHQSIEKIGTLVKPTDSVILLSALTPDKGKDIATFNKNIAMMANLVAALKISGCAHFVYFSSDAVYSTQSVYVNESTLAAPGDLYGLMHRTREIMGKELNTPYLILRPTLVYGDGDTHNAYGPNRFTRNALSSGKISLFGGGEELRDHIAVEDVANLTTLCVQSKAEGILNLATGNSISFYEVTSMVKNSFSLNVEIEKSVRQNPIWHRHFDITRLIKRFPKYRFKSLSEYIARYGNKN
jgi:nucleoside-diphosphate-sugar epimerase